MIDKRVFRFGFGVAIIVPWIFALSVLVGKTVGMSEGEVWGIEDSIRALVSPIFIGIGAGLIRASFP